MLKIIKIIMYVCMYNIHVKFVWNEKYIFNVNDLFGFL